MTQTAAVVTWDSDACYSGVRTTYWHSDMALNNEQLTDYNTGGRGRRALDRCSYIWTYCMSELLFLDVNIGAEIPIET